MTFALLHRPETFPGTVELLRCGTGPAAPGEDVLLVVPAGAAPPVTLRVLDRSTMPVAVALRTLPAELPELGDGDFDLSDEEYAAVTRRVLDENIARGDGANFVIRRTYRADYPQWSAEHAKALFRRLLLAESGAYWTFVVHWAGRTLAGATPERHVRMRGGRVSMTPISGTYRYPPDGPDAAGLRRFLADPKERDELLMVVDEELKMMARVCAGGGRVRGPRLRPMARLAHTEYEIEGPSDLAPAEVLRLTMPVPTVTGSPVARARRVVAAHERTDRRCYGGVLALVTQHDTGPEMDSALIIRTADIDAGGRVEVAVGATLVWGSDPAAEAAETRAKAATVLAALRREDAPPVPPAPHRPGELTGELTGELIGRNDGLSRFWLGRERPVPVPAGRRMLIVDAEDDFTAMLARMAEALGLDVRVEPWHRDPPTAGADVVLIGPGPGDPRDRTDPRIARLHAITRRLLAARTPLLAVCLGHQVLADELGLVITRMGESAQGVRRTITVDGRPERVGFYHSFTAVSAHDEVRGPLTAGPVRIHRDGSGQAVHSLSGPGLHSVQFHVESLLTENGPALLERMTRGVLSGSRSLAVR
ncbi:anthranilate synthase family protein [Actinoplanes sp. NPDC051494]|uniref:anthranilate synthase family protein n=1 Tax=Actinoplanes sp. NPDC051494 TaxID=3363907 RepID=UPI0037A7225C